MESFDNMPQRRRPAALAHHGMGVVFVHDHVDQDGDADGEDHRDQAHHIDHLRRDLPDEARSDNECRDHPKAIQQPLDGRRGKYHGQVKLLPVRQQVAADQLPGAQRENLICEQADIDGLHGAKQRQLANGAEHNIPAPAVADIDREVKNDAEGYPFPVELLDLCLNLAQVVAVQHPCQAGNR